MTLRDALAAFSLGWRDDLSADWRAMLGNAEPNPLAVAAPLTFDDATPIYPARRPSPLPGARADAHVFRAFDGLPPARVRCVLIGQDPYPALSRATGRSFEQGDLTTWARPAGEVAASLRNLVRMLVAARADNHAFATGSWQVVMARAASAEVALEAPVALFDRLQKNEGVLFLNAGLTITRYKSGGAPEQTQGHLPFWRPVVGSVLRALATRSNGQLALLCLGSFAQQLVVREGVQAAATTAGAWGARVRSLALPHPVAPAFMNGTNPFLAVNEQLQQMGAPPISW